MQQTPNLNTSCRPMFWQYTNGSVVSFQMWSKKQYVFKKAIDSHCYLISKLWVCVCKSGCKRKDYITSYNNNELMLTIAFSHTTAMNILIVNSHAAFIDCIYCITIAKLFSALFHIYIFVFLFSHASVNFFHCFFYCRPFHMQVCYYRQCFSAPFVFF